MLGTPNPHHSNSSDSQEINEVTERMKRLENNVDTEVLNKVAKKVEFLEDSIHSHFLLCRGPRVSAKIEESTNGRVINLNQIKAELCNEICGESVSEISVDSLSLHLQGKDKNMLKIECVNT